ncbi:hypothetical protein [uncultured Parabacteroides sp.]|uniref:hypothetical protein n=1 Tax=uncultured Parabacteroides sp. TaxID=512312 RepID=UPI0025946A49|nr:hypothetical protein [uncultured Parabacteroides sp.]
MRRNEEDEIEVLGTLLRRREKGKAVWVGLSALCLLLLLGGVVWLGGSSENEELSEEETTETEQPVIVASDTLSRKTSSIVLSVDSINDVKIRMYALHGLSVRLSLDLPDKGDTTLLLVVQAADIRRDNGGIVGDFVLRGERLSRGKRKSGYCAIRDGQVVLGNAVDDDMMEQCIQQKGDFFRQYPLVMNGEIQENRLKGKALRRALARQGGNLYFVESCNHESVYDFSEALVDFGFSEALYLVGGSAYGWWRETDGTVHELGKQDTYISKPNLNYLLFCRTESH